MVSMLGYNFLQSLKKFLRRDSEPPYFFENLRWLWIPSEEFF